MSDRIHVAIRVRPLNAREDAESVAWASDSTSISQISAETNRPNGVTYTFDRVYDPYIGTEEVYNNTASDIIKSVLEGVNGTIFAYGQTSSGKTFTMRGNSASPGIISLAIDDIFKFIQQSPNTDFLLRVSYMEIYNEVITDLLNPSNTNLKIHEDIERGVYVGGATEEIVTSQFQMLGILARGDANRKVGQTMMNTSSSRSHSIFRMVIESSEKDAENGVKSSSQGRLSVQLPGGRASKSAAPSLLGRSAVKVSLLNLVDLAGSERARQTGAAGIRLKEGSHINKSLLTLERVISKLSDGKKESAAAHIPYRDSKLTRILQPALGGNSRTAIICNVTPAWIHQEESHSTLKFASAAKKISNKPQVNEVVTDQALLQRYRTQISSLEEQIEAMKRQQEDSASMIASSSLASSLTHSTQTSPSRLSVGSMGSAAEASLSPIEAPLSAEEVYRRKEQLLQLTDGIVSAKKLKKMAKNRRQTWCPGPSMSTAEAERILASVQTPSRENGPPSTFRDASPSLLSFSGAASPSASNLINFGDDEFDMMISSSGKSAIQQHRSSFDGSESLKPQSLEDSASVSVSNAQLEEYEQKVTDLELALRQAQDALRTTEETLADLRDESSQREASYQDQLESALSSITEMKDRLDEKEKALQASAQEMQTSGEKIVALEAAVSASAERCASLEGQLDAFETTLEEQMRLLTEEHLMEEEKLKDEMEALRSELEVLKSAAPVADETERIGEMEALLLEQQALLEAQSTETVELRAECEQKTAAVDDLTEQLKLSEASLAASREKSQALEGELLVAKEAHATAQAAMETAVAQAKAESDLAVQSLQVDLDAIKLSSETVLTQLEAKHQEEAEALRTALETKQSEIEALEAQLGLMSQAQEKADKHAVMSSQLAASSSELELLMAKNRDLVEANETLNVTLQDCQQQLSAVEAMSIEYKSLKSQKAALDAQLSAALEEKEGARSDSVNLRDSLRLLQAESLSTNSLHQQSEGDKEKWKKKATQLQTAVDLMEQTAQKSEAQLAELKLENKRLLANVPLLERKDDELGIANAKVEQLRKQVQALSSAGGQFEESAQKYQAEISELQFELSRTKSSINRISVLEAENQDLLRQVSTLKAERVANAESSSSNGSKVKAMQQEIEALERKLSEVSASVYAAEDARAEAEQSAQKVSRELASLRQQFESVVAKHKTEKQRFVEQEAEWEDRLRSRGSAADELSDEVENLRSENARLDRELTQYAQQMDAWKVHANEAAQRINAAATEKATLERDLAVVSEQCEALRLEVAEFQSREKLLLKRQEMETKALADELASLKKETKATAGKKAAMEKEKESSARDIEKLKEQLQKERDRVQLLTQDKSSLVQEKATQERELKTAKAALASLESVMKKAEGAGSKSDAKLKELQSVHAQLEKKHSEALKALERVEKMCESATSDAARLKVDVEKARAEGDKARTEGDKARSDAREIQLDLERVQRALEELQATHAALEAVCTTHEQAIVHLQLEAEAEQQTLEDTKMQYNTALNELQTLTDRVAELTAELSASEARVSALEGDVASAQQLTSDFEAQIAQLNEALIETSMEREEAKAAMNSALDEAATLLDEVTQCQEQLTAAEAQREETQSKLHSLQQELAAVTTQSQKLTCDLANLVAERDALVNDKVLEYQAGLEARQALEAAKSALLAEKSVLEASKATLEAERAAEQAQWANEKAELTQDVQNIAADLEAEVARAAEVESARSAMEAQLVELEAQLASFEAERANMDAEMESLAQTIVLMGQDKDATVQRCEALVTQWQATASDLERDLAAMQTQQLQDQARISDLTVLSEESVLSLEQLEKQLEAMRVDLDAAHSQLEAARAELETTRAELASSQETSSAAAQAAAVSQEAVAAAAAAALTASQEAESLVTRLNAAEAELEETRAKLSLATEQVSGQAATQAEMEAQVAELTEAIEYYKSQESTAGEMMHSQETELVDAKKLVSSLEAEVKMYKQGYAKKKIQFEQLSIKYETLLEEAKKSHLALKQGATAKPSDSTSTAKPLAPKTPSAAASAEANKENTNQPQILF